MEVTTRVEDEEVEAVEGEEIAEERSFSDIGSSEDELEGLATFNIKEARNHLYNLENCYMVMIKKDTQKFLGLEVGINVSQEFPWKRVLFDLLANHFFDYVENGEMLQDFFIRYKPDDTVLMGYAPSLIGDDEDIMEDDPFVIYVSKSAEMEAAAIIKNIEIYERYMMNKKILKKPRPWVSKGSEKEVDEGVSLPKEQVVDIEIQTVFPTFQTKAQLTIRDVNDVRDGYVELLPGEVRYVNVHRQLVHIGIQSAPKLRTLEQQTDPTFPGNAWAQYLYEIKDTDGDGLDLTSEDEDDKPKPGSKPATPVPKKPKEIPQMSKTIKDLLNDLDFNHVDMYRNDYPMIAISPVKIFTHPYMEEIFCFANIAKSNERFVSAVDWYPFLTGIIVAAYTFTTKVTTCSILAKKKVDPIQRMILQPNPILLWSFMDSLNYKLEFETPREVTALSFCPYDDNILIGGTANGQIIIWDLQDRVKNLEVVEQLTMLQAAHRELIAEFLSWTIPYDDTTWIFPAAVSALEGSQTAEITEIKWAPRKYYLSNNGRVHESKHLRRFFVTLSVDGTIAFWNLDFDIGAKAKSSVKKYLPPELSQSASVYKKLDRVIKSIFQVNYSEPLTSFIINTAAFKYTPLIETRRAATADIKTYPIKVVDITELPFTNTVIVGSFNGRIDQIQFTGVDSGLLNNKENISIPAYKFARVHDGPIVALEQNPSYPELFVSVGKTIMAIWKADFPLTPIMWRIRPVVLTGAKWSTDRPAVLFLSRVDGSFEAWDLLARDDDACLVQVLGGGIITVLSEHRAAIPKKVISIGDYNSSFRLVALPETFYKPIPDELNLLQEYVNKEVHRKKGIHTWRKVWRTVNADIIEERKRAKAEAANELEQLRIQLEEAKKPKTEPRKQEENKPKGPYYELIEKLEKKWDAFNYKRLMKNLMSRKKVDAEKLRRETAIEKERLNYEERKKASIKQIISKVSEEIAAIRARLLPVEKKDVQLIDMVKNSVKTILEMSPTYHQVEDECNEYLELHAINSEINPTMIFYRCRLRRKLLNKALGLSYEREEFTENAIKDKTFLKWHYDYENFYGLEREPSVETMLEEVKGAEMIIPAEEEEAQAQVVDVPDAQEEVGAGDQ